MSLLESRKLQIIQRGAELVTKIENALSITLPPIDYDFLEITGRVAGRARWNRITQKATILFNPQGLLDDFEDAIENTLPHEMAHIVCMVFPRYGNNHNRGWRRVAAFLGATPRATGVNNAIIYGSGDTYTYTDTLGGTHNVSANMHRKIQNGSQCVVRSTQAKINSSCKFVIANQSNLVEAARTTSGSAIGAPATGTKASKARVIHRQCVEQGLSYDETIKLMSEGSGYSIALAKACYKDGQEKHGIGK